MLERFSSFHNMITVHHVPKCMSWHKPILVITGRTHCFHDCIYITLILLLWDLSTLCVVDPSWPLMITYISISISISIYLSIYLYIYIYNCITVPLILKGLTDRHIWKEKQKQKPTLFLTKQCWSPRYKAPVLSTRGGCHPEGFIVTNFYNFRYIAINHDNNT